MKVQTKYKNQSYSIWHRWRYKLIIVFGAATVDKTLRDAERLVTNCE